MPGSIAAAIPSTSAYVWADCIWTGGVVLPEATSARKNLVLHDSEGIKGVVAKRRAAGAADYDQCAAGGR